MFRLIVAFTPLVGAIAFPLLIPTTIERLGLGPGVLSALILSTLWFIAMLRTSETVSYTHLTLPTKRIV